MNKKHFIYTSEDKTFDVIKIIGTVKSEESSKPRKYTLVIYQSNPRFDKFKNDILSPKIQKLSLIRLMQLSFSGEFNEYNDYDIKIHNIRFDKWRGDVTQAQDYQFGYVIYSKAPDL